MGMKGRRRLKAGLKASCYIYTNAVISAYATRACFVLEEVDRPFVFFSQ